MVERPTFIQLSKSNYDNVVVRREYFQSQNNGARFISVLRNIRHIKPLGVASTLVSAINRTTVDKQALLILVKELRCQPLWPFCDGCKSNKPGKHDTWSRCCFNIGLSSWMVAQHKTHCVQVSSLFGQIRALIQHYFF